MLQNKIKVVHFPRWFPNNQDSTAGIFILKHIQVTNAFAQNAVIFADFYNAKTAEERYTENDIFFVKKVINERLFGIRHIDVFVKNFLLLWFQIISFLKYKKQYGKPNLLHVHVLTRNAIIPFLISKIYTIPYVITEHWSRYTPADNSFNGWFRIKITRLIVAHAQAVMPVSKALQDGMLRFDLKGKFEIIPNVVDTEIFCLRTKITLNKSKIIFVGSLENEVKNTDTILQVIKRIITKNNQTELTIIGDGDSRNALQQYVLDNELQDNIHFLGKISPKDVAKKMSEHDFLILFSHIENLPCVLLEAMSCGLPVIAPNVGGVSEIVNAQNGIIVPLHDNVAFEKAIEHLQKTHHTYNRERLHNYIQRRFSNEAVGEQIKQVYLHSLN